VAHAKNSYIQKDGKNFEKVEKIDKNNKFTTHFSDNIRTLETL